MELNNLLEIGQSVFYFDLKEHKINKGIINGISIFIDGSGTTYMYSINKIDPYKGPSPFSLPNSYPPDLIFRDKDEILDFCLKLSEHVVQ